MKCKFFLYLLLLLIYTTTFGQVDSNFSPNVFLNLNTKTVYLFKDSISDLVKCEIQNNPVNDQYFEFQIVGINKDRVKVIGHYTIDAGHYDSVLYNGWISIQSLYVYYNKEKRKIIFLYQKNNMKSAKKTISDLSVKYPLQIKKVSFSNGELWLQVVIKRKGKETIFGWLSPELQCADIWNACNGN